MSPNRPPRTADAAVTGPSFRPTGDEAATDGAAKSVDEGSGAAADGKDRPEQEGGSPTTDADCGGISLSRGSSDDDDDDEEKKEENAAATAPERRQGQQQGNEAGDSGVVGVDALPRGKLGQESNRAGTNIGSDRASIHGNNANLVVHVAEAMNAAKRSNMEDRHAVHLGGRAWGAPSPREDETSYLAVYDGHGGRDIVDFLEHGLAFHVARELRGDNGGGGDDDDDLKKRIERAFLMADIHSRQAGLITSGSTVAMCLIKPVDAAADAAAAVDVGNGDDEGSTSDTSNTCSSGRSNKTVLKVTAANVGDARIVLGTSDGRAVRLTRDHNAFDSDEVTRIEEAGGFLFKNRVVGICKCFAVRFLLRPELFARKGRHLNCFLLSHVLYRCCPLSAHLSIISGGNAGFGRSLPKAVRNRAPARTRNLRRVAGQRTRRRRTTAAECDG